MDRPKPRFYTRFTPPPSVGVTAVGGLTEQHFKDECDINHVLKSYRVGIPPPSSPGVYADLTSVPVDLADAFDRVQSAVDWFNDLPSSVRSAFNNDPRNALRLINSDLSAAIAAGLLPSGAVSQEAKPIKAKAAEAASPEPAEKPAKPPEAA